MCQTALQTPKVLRGILMPLTSRYHPQENKGYESLRQRLRPHIGFDASIERAFLPETIAHRDQLHLFQ